MSKSPNRHWNEDEATGQRPPKEYMGCDIRPASYVFNGMGTRKRIEEKYGMPLEDFIQLRARGEI